MFIEDVPGGRELAARSYTDEVRMFDRGPVVDEVLEVVSGLRIPNAS
jgi:hypothetical protein